MPHGITQCYLPPGSGDIPANKVSPRGRRNDMPPPLADGSSTVAKIAADPRPSAEGFAVRTSLVAGGG